MNIDAILSIIVSILATIGTASQIKDALNKLTWINENFRQFLLYPLVLIFSIIFYLFMAFLVIQVIGNGFIEVGRFYFPKRKANLDFPIPIKSKDVLLEIHNSERHFELSDISIRLYSIEQVPDKFGKLPIEQEIFDNRYFGIGHKPMDEGELMRKEGGAIRSGEVFVPAQQSVFFYLFELDEYGSMNMPQIKLRLDEFPKGGYLFDFEFIGYVKNKRTPNYISVSVKNTGDEIIIASIEQDCERVVE